MSRFNLARTDPTKTVNDEGAPAYSSMNAEQALYVLTASNIYQDSYYSSKEFTQKSIINFISRCDPYYVMKLALYLRTKMHLRTIPLILIAELAKLGELEAWIVPKVIQRADEITELVAYWGSISGHSTVKKMPNQLKKGLAQAMKKFSLYSFRKYNKGDKNSVTFRDVLRIVHPKADTPEMNEIFKAIANKELPPIETWETKLSSTKEKGISKVDAWISLIEENKMGYMAVLRNLRNMIIEQVPLETYDKALAFISDKQAVLKSKQFPFRWYSAYSQIWDLGDIRVSPTVAALDQAVRHSADNIPGLDFLDNKSVLIACDVSGSMRSPLSKNSAVELIDVGIILGKLIKHKYRYAVTGVFGTKWKPFDFSPSLMGAEHLPDVGLSTNAHETLKWAIANNKQFDKLMFFSDMQIYHDINPSNGEFNSAWKAYKKLFPSAEIYLFNLASYNVFPISLLGNDVYMVTGWSDHIFEILNGWKNIKEVILGMD